MKIVPVDRSTRVTPPGWKRTATINPPERADVSVLITSNDPDKSD